MQLIIACCALFITHCIIDIVSSECNPHHFVHSMHCVLKYHVLHVQHKDVIIRFLKALDFSVGVGG